MTLLSLIVGPKHSILGPHEQLGSRLQVPSLKLYARYLQIYCGHITSLSKLSYYIS